MHPDLSQWFGIVCGGLGLVTTLSCGWVVLRSSIFRQTSDGWQKLAEQRGEENKGLREQIAAFEKRIEHLEQKDLDKTILIEQLMKMIPAGRHPEREMDQMLLKGSV